MSGRGFFRPLVLGDVAADRDNNFNLIRFTAATMVLVSHSWSIALGVGTVEPLVQATGHTLGSLAVYVFFVISGFLVTGSYLRHDAPWVFVRARVLRLMPGLAVSLMLVVTVLGMVATTLPLWDYVTHHDTAGFMLRNLTLVWPQYTLPGVFKTLPYPAVEGPIWTLAYEVICYGLVFVAGVSGVLARRRWMAVALMAYGLLWIALAASGADLHRRLELLHTLSLPFMIGVAFRIWQDRIRLSLWVAIALLGAAALARDTPLAFPVLTLAMSYATFWCAYVPGGVLRAFNRLGDYSYGIYIYAFPLQGLVIWIWGPMGPGLNIALAFPLTLVCAILSWHLIERPALRLVVARDGKRPLYKHMR